ncbi:amino acid ABC transporter permease [Paenarthrobacter nitroguajacolicus]|uniref:Amino acid ABC transporter permease n=1 Tax=Paenarthrobacter nitroguajacolicus TaxID=211146 RepID=A0A558H427_PAENT|nr:amino acid ABC transporter permease [Paenarthrobacter nitroguajacolicus]TVU63877.1 amino acid ABC transporter permease [Paenarthrobacter nitroguajacolicus]
MTFFNDWVDYFPDLLGGLGVSLQLTLVTLLIGLPAGLVLALAAGSKKRVVRVVAIGVIEVGRGTPALVVLQLFYFGLPTAGMTLTSFVAASLALAFTTAAYTSEILRGGLQAVPSGEVEAAHALGMARGDILRFVVIPQGIRIAIPPLMGFAIMVFQATSLAYTIAMPELMSQAYSIGSITFRYLSILTLAGLMYALITIPASSLSNFVEYRLARHR